MYAIVKTGGKQYRVEQGQRLLVERLPVQEGETVKLQPLLYRSDEVICDAASLAGVEVSAKVLAHQRGEKLRVFKFKPKRGYRRRTGHRQELTRIEVTDISLRSQRAGAATKTAKPQDSASTTAGAGSKPAAERGKQPAAKDGKQTVAKDGKQEASDGS